MNELNCGQEEQYAGPEKKKSTSKIVKRTLVVAALALAVYVVYSVVYLFVSPDRNIQQIYLVPEDAAFIIQSSAPIEDWEKFSGSETWQCLKKAKSFEEVTESVEKLDSVVKSNKGYAYFASQDSCHKVGFSADSGYAENIENGFVERPGGNRIGHEWLYCHQPDA